MRANALPLSCAALIDRERVRASSSFQNAHDLGPLAASAPSNHHGGRDSPPEKPLDSSPAPMCIIHIRPAARDHQGDWSL